ncbi:MAG: nucleotidyltransferase domain-containing protein [Candidatus Omnitrophica bacterium]|nr:nucleotidyltransferase domain-containing protein [Candidatus Omnitrophota bacterium]
MRLEKDGIFISQKKGNLCYYSLNKAYPLFEELRSIVFKTIGIQGVLSKMLRTIPNIDSAFIYGSYAKNETHAGSDIDVFIVGSPNEDVIVEKINALEKKLKRDINYSIYPHTDFMKKKKARDSFIKDVLSNDKIFLIGTSNDL